MENRPNPSQQSSVQTVLPSTSVQATATAFRSQVRLGDQLLLKPDPDDPAAEDGPPDGMERTGSQA